MKLRRFSILIHMAGWLIYLLLSLLKNPHTTVVYAAKVTLGITPLYYAIAHVLTHFIRKPRWWLAPLMLIALFPVVLVYAYTYVYALLPLWDVQMQRPDAVFSATEFSRVVGLFYLQLVLYAALIEATQQAVRFLTDKRIAEKERNRVRDTMLRFQISTHFQFNALNVVAANAAASDDQTTLEIVRRMASLQRYSMEAAAERMSLVALSREISKLDEFVKLVCFRHGGLPVMQLSITGELAGQAIPPVVLLTKADNMVRHGVLSVEHPGILRLALYPDGYTFFCRNRIRSDMRLPAESNGTGLANVRQRLDLLLPGQYTLETSKEKGEFIGILTVTHTQHETKRTHYLRHRRRRSPGDPAAESAD